MAKEATMEWRRKERFERDRISYEQNYQHFRSLNLIMWQVPLLAMTLTGGLWFGSATGKVDNITRVLLLALAASGNVGLLLVLGRLRFIMDCYLEAIKGFHPPAYVNVAGPGIRRRYLVRNVFQWLLALSAIVSVVMASATLFGYPARAMQNLNLTDVAVEEYERNAAAYVGRYESVAFDDVHSGVLDLLPKGPARVADIGTGSGRDAAALADRGYQIVAVDPSPSMLAEARRRHLTKKVAWLQDQLPELAGLKSLGFQFDLVLLSAVWMHVNPADRASAMATIASITAQSGLVIFVLRQGADDILRGIAATPLDEVKTMAAAAGFGLVRQNEKSDLLGRDAVRWATLVFRKS